MYKSLWIGEIKKEFKDGTHWAKLRIKKDVKVNEKYIDVLVGKKDKQWHMHIGINLDQTIRFTQFRGVTHSITREVKSLKRGFLENKKVLVDPTVSPGKTLVLKINMDGDTREISINEFRLGQNSH
jgi:hypothetical protein